MRLVLFDLDGTLIDSRRSITDAMTAAFVEGGLEPPTPEATASIVGISLEKAVAALAPQLDEETRANITARYRAAYLRSAATPGADPLYAGIEEILGDLDRRGFLLGVATGKSRSGAEAALTRNGIRERFVTLQTGDGGPSKPHPDVILRGLRDTGAEARRTVMVGDATYDILAARAAGVGSIGVTWGFQTRADLEGAGADIIVDRAEDVVPAILRILDEREGATA